eukprot:1136908-Pelagomonas_calceolata.AAC.9
MISCAAGVHGHVSCCIECVRAAGGGAGHQPVALEHVLDQSGDDARPQVREGGWRGLLANIQFALEHVLGESEDDTLPLVWFRWANWVDCFEVEVQRLIKGEGDVGELMSHGHQVHVQDVLAGTS